MLKKIEENDELKGVKTDAVTKFRKVKVEICNDDVNGADDNFDEDEEDRIIGFRSNICNCSLLPSLSQLFNCTKYFPQ